MVGIGIILAAAAIGFGISRWLNLPAIPCLIFGGFIVSAVGLTPDAEIMQDALILGLTFLVFVAGIELDPDRIGRLGRVVFRVGIWQFVVLGIAGILTALAFGFPRLIALYMGLALAASSTLVVVRTLQQRRQSFEPFGRLSIGVLLLQDVAVILLIPVLSALPEGFLAAGGGLLSALVLFGLAYVVMMWVAPYLFIHQQPDEETSLLTMLGLVFLFMGAGYLLGLPLIAGAFVSGVALSRFPISGVVRSQLSSISDFFTALFFTALGAFITIPGLQDLVIALVFTVVVLTVTPLLVTIVAERAGLSARPAIETGLLLAQTSEFSIVIGLQALAIGHIPVEVLTIIVLVTAVTMLLTPFISAPTVTWKLVHWYPLAYSRTLQERPRDHILMLGCGQNAMPLLETLLLSGHNVFVVDEDPTVIDDLRTNDVACLRGDGADVEVLEATGIEDAKIVLSLMRRPQDARPAIMRSENIPVLVRVFHDEDADYISSLGGTPISYAEASAETFLTWFGEFNENKTQ